MQTIDLATIQASVSWKDALEAARRAFRALADGAVDQPGQIEMRPPSGGELHVKGAHLHGSSILCFKVATGGFPGAPSHGLSLVIDARDGAPLWLLADDGWLTDTRTAAAGALASATLARDDARTLLVVGSGVQARAQVLAHREALPDLRVTVWGRDAAKASALARSLGGDADVVSDLRGGVETADIVVTATSSRAPLIEAEWLRPGVHVTAVGSDTAGKQELSAAVLDRADLVVCDDVALASHAGELQHAGHAVRARAGTLGDILTGRRAGRTSLEQITVADLCGLGAQDAAIAEVVVKHLAGSVE